MSRETLLCVFQVLSLEFFRNGSTFLGLPEGQNMVSLSHGTSVKNVINDFCLFASQMQFLNNLQPYVCIYRVFYAKSTFGFFSLLMLNQITFNESHRTCSF